MRANNDPRSSRTIDPLAVGFIPSTDYAGWQSVPAAECVPFQGGGKSTFPWRLGLLLLIGRNRRPQRTHGTVSVIHHPLHPHQDFGGALGEHGGPGRRWRLVGFYFVFGDGGLLAGLAPGKDRRLVCFQ